MKPLPNIAIIGLGACLALIIIGCILAINSCATPAGAEESLPVTRETLHYPDLDRVILPEGTPSQIKDYTGFSLSFNKQNHTPNYVAWELLGEEISNEVERNNNFWQDFEVEGCPSYKDYTGSGYDRGHMCPAADQKWSIEAMNDCFVMANMCPQDHNLNAGAWNTLENKERQWARRDSAIIIIAGPVFDDSNKKTFGKGNVNIRVPSAFFKVFLAPYVESPRAIAFVYPNMASPGNMQDYAMSVDDLENILGYDFFSALPDSLENRIEANYSFVEWNRTKKTIR